MIHTFQKIPVINYKKPFYFSAFISKKHPGPFRIQDCRGGYIIEGGISVLTEGDGK
jgi:hypothetical protein